MVDEGIGSTRSDDGDVRDRLPEELARALRPALVSDYAAWLSAYRACGHRVAIEDDADFADIVASFVVATADFRLEPRYGREALNVIVPLGVRFLGGELGHSTLFFHDGPRSTDRAVAAYRDTPA